MILCLLLSIAVCSSPLRRRDYQDSLRFSEKLALFTAAVCLIGTTDLAPDLWIAGGLLIGIFSLLVLLEASLPVGLKKETQSTGWVLGLYNTIQYGSMTLGSLCTVYATETPIFLIGLSILALVLNKMLKIINFDQ